MYYRYIAYTEDKKIYRGTQEAANEAVATRVLAGQGYKIISIKPTSGLLTGHVQILRFLKKVSLETIVTFSRQVALLHESGIDIVTSLEMLKDHVTVTGLRQALERILIDLKKGARLSEAMAKHTNVFPKIYVRSIQVGEQTGNLEAVLRQMADHLEREARSAKGVRNALKYPSTVVIVGILVLAVMNIFVFPAFNSLYKQLNVELPAITRALMWLMEWSTAYGLYIFALIGVAILIFILWSRTAAGKLHKDRMALRILLLGKVIHLNELIRFCRNMSILYKAGLPVPEILALVIETSGNMAVNQSLTRVRQSVLRGESLSRSMSRDPIFYSMLVQMVGVGESTGSLDKTLAATADTYETEAEERMRNIIGLIQPTVTIVMGVIVGVIALSVVSAMYSMYGQIGG